MPITQDSTIQVAPVVDGCPVPTEIFIGIVDTDCVMIEPIAIDPATQAWRPEAPIEDPVREAEDQPEKFPAMFIICDSAQLPVFNRLLALDPKRLGEQSVDQPEGESVGITYTTSGETAEVTALLRIKTDPTAAEEIIGHHLDDAASVTHGTMTAETSCSIEVLNECLTLFEKVGIWKLYLSHRDGQALMVDTERVVTRVNRQSPPEQN